MKGTMMTFAPLSVLLGWVLLGDCMTIRSNFPRQNANVSIPLDMAEKSIDDMYFGCHDTAKIVVQKYFQKEKLMKPFGVAWKRAETCAEKKLKVKQREDKALTKDHLQAICAYTGRELYQDFNKAVRTQGNMYGTTFQFHYLHFTLTSAIQILNSNQKCHITYRRVKCSFTGSIGQIIPFGKFASSSFRKDLKEFGSETCFQIKTCLGAFLKEYSSFPAEKEVLIPPYELFNITKINNGKTDIKGLTDCKRVYVLESAGVHSNLNCKVTKR